MSHLLYLHTFEWSRFEAIFGRSTAADVVALCKNVPAAVFGVKPEEIEALARGAMTRKIEYAGWSSKAAQILDRIVDAAFMTRKLGLRTRPISPEGMSGVVLDAFEARFQKAKARELLQMLRTGRRVGQRPGRYDSGFFLLAPGEIGDTVAALRKVAGLANTPLTCRPYDVEPFETCFVEELIEPLESAARRPGRGALGKWC